MKSIPETLIEKLAQTLSVHHLNGKKIGVAYSGGMDSAVLLWSVCQVVPQVLVYALHIDHGLRPESERLAEKALAASFARQLGCSFESLGPPELLDYSRGVEAAAREFRYETLIASAERLDLSSILLAHHADDQAETIFMRILQGRSWDGLSGMQESLVRKKVLFLRPFLSFEKSLLEQAARESMLAFWNDSTNQQSDYLRNTVRREVFPLLEKLFPAFRRSLSDLGAQWKAFYPKEVLHQAWKGSGRCWQLPLQVWKALNQQQRLGQLLRVLDHFDRKKTVSRRFLESLCASSKTSGLIGEGAGLQLLCKKGFVVWKEVAEKSLMGYFVRTRADIPFELNGHHLVYTSFVGSGDKVFSLPGIDSQRPLVWKNRFPGERFDLGNGTLTDKTWRKSLESESLVYVYQDFVLKAVLDLDQEKVIWKDVQEAKLQSFGIFVTFRQRSYS